MADKINKDRLIQVKNEILMAEALNDEELQPQVREALQRYTGTHIPNIGTDWDVILNEIYPVIQFNLPSIFFRNPKAYLKPRNKTFIKKARNPITGKMEEVQADSTESARTQEHLLNYELTQIRYKQEVRKVLLDALLFPHGILWHGYKGDFGMTAERSLYIRNEKIFVKRISPMKFLKDPSVSFSEIEEGRWVARIIDIPLQDLLEDDDLDVDKQSIRGFDAFGEMVGTQSQKQYINGGGKDKLSLGSLKKPLLDFSQDQFRKSARSKFVRLYEVFLRPSKKDAREGKPGKILLLTDEQEKPLRESNWTIKAEGFPCKLLEFNAVPDATFGMPDIDTYKIIADQKNAIVNLQLRNAQENSKVWIGISKEDANEEDVDMVKDGNQTIVRFEGGNPRERMFIASAGGTASNELFLIDGRIQRNLEDKSGVSDLKRGFLQSGEESATSVKIRNAFSAARPQYRQDLMGDFLNESVLYINQLQKQFLTYKDAVRLIGSLDVEWSENPSKEDIQADVDVEIDVQSMLPENPERELQELQTVLQMMVEGLANPIVAGKIKQEGNTVNLSPLIEQILFRLKIRNPEIFRKVRPDESDGYVSVQQLQQAKQNVGAVLSGQQPPYPPSPQDDHRAKLEVYSSTQEILKLQGQVSQALDQIMQMQVLLLQQEMEKEPQAGKPVNLKKPSTLTI